MGPCAEGNLFASRFASQQEFLKQKGIPQVGNERKLQKTWQALPLRPQNLFIVGASFLKRVFINALIKFASVFSNSKVLARIRFVEMDSVREKIPKDNMPVSLGGKQHDQTVDQWVLERLSNYDGLKFGDDIQCTDGYKIYTSLRIINTRV